MKLEILTPEHRILEAEIDAVQVPGLEGQFQILEDHAPMISTLQEGSVKIDLPSDHQHLDSLEGGLERDMADDQILRLPIKGGVIEVQQNHVILLAD